MCRNIKTLCNFEPTATDEEVRAAAIQFVCKLSGFNKPSQVNQGVFDQVVDNVAVVARQFVDDRTTSAAARAAQRFGTPA